MNTASRFCAEDEAPSILSALLENSDDAVIRTDLDGSVVGWNPGATRLYGYSAEEMVGSPVGLLIPEERWDEFARMFERIQSGAVVNHHETVRRTKDGRLIDVLLSIVPIVDALTGLVSVVSITRDRTALKQAEADYRASDARWRAIFDSAADGIVVMDAGGIVRSFNRAAERLFGYRAEEVVGRSVNVLMPPPFCDEHDQYLARYLGGGSPRIIGIGREVVARRRTGEDFLARLAVGEASVDGHTHFTGILHDLTERMEIEKRLREQTALAKVGEMSAVVAHEVRNALAGARGVIEVIAGRLPDGSREGAIAGEVIRRLDAVTTMVKDLLLFAHLPEPKLELMDVGQLVESTVAAVRNDPAFQHVRLEVEGTAPQILGDVGLLRTVLLNLLTNSAQAMTEAGAIRILMETTGDSAHIVVADEGPGVPPDARERLFTPFFTTKTRGSGLGLATARRIIEAHGGALRLENPLEGGTRAIIDLPIQTPSAG